jgi:hypothetical protein
MVMKEAVQRLPLNEEGLPLGFYRADLISPESVVKSVIGGSGLPGANSILDASSLNPNSGSSDLDASASHDTTQVVEEDARSAPRESTNTTHSASSSNPSYNSTQITLILDSQELQCAYVPLSYDQGYPETPGGYAFWQRLECEPQDAYAAFDMFIKSGAKGTRRLYELVQEVPLQQAIIRARNSMFASSQDEDDDVSHTRIAPPTQVHELHVPLEQLQSWYYEYMWALRVKAYDLQNFERLRRERQMLSVQLEEQHFLDASKIYRKVMGLIDGSASEALDEEGNNKFFMNAQPRVLVELLKLTSQMQRLSVGLLPNTPSFQVDGLRKPQPTKEELESKQGIVDPESRAQRIAALLEIARSRKAS